MIIEKIKEKIEECVRSGKTVERDVLKLTLSECQRLNKFDDNICISVVNKLIDSNLETLKYGHNTKLVKENCVLKELLPETLSVDDIIINLSPIKDDLEKVGSGKNIGMAIKYLKNKSLSFNSKDVGKALEKMFS